MGTGRVAYPGVFPSRVSGAPRISSNIFNALSRTLLNEDFTDILAALLEESAQFLVVGAYALAVHGLPRATGDLDIWIRSDAENVECVWKALQRFGAPIETLEISKHDLATPGVVIQLGLPPRRIDLLNRLSGVEFESAWEARILRSIGSLEVPFIDRSTLLQNKRATGRLKDLADVETLENQDR
jgi:hypothetical protein